VHAQTAERKTAEERRAAVLEAALTEFGDRGFEGASTDAIARAAGISQPYLFRLFGSKKELFIASIEGCFAETYSRFDEAAKGLEGEPALEAMGRAYKAMIADDPRRLREQMQSYAACDDPDIAAVVRRGFGLRGRDADQRHGLDGCTRRRGAVGGVLHRRADEGLGVFFSPAL